MQTKIVLEPWARAAILRGGTKASGTTLLSREAPVDEQTEHAMIGVAEPITISAET